MWFLRRPTASRLDQLLASVVQLPLSYPEVGMSRPGAAVPERYGREQHAVDLDVAFADARHALAGFATHELPYLFIHPAGARVTPGLDVIVCARVGPLWTANPCRVVHVEDTPERYVYAYGTLPGHSEHGEELFSVERLPDGRVRAETIAHARPQDVLARLGKPIAHRVQRRIKVDYMQALARRCGRIVKE